MLPTFSQNVTPQEAFESAAQKNEKLKTLCSVFCKQLKPLIIRFLHFFAKRRKSVEKNWGHLKSKIVNPGKAIAMAICPIILAREAWPDVWICLHNKDARKQSWAQQPA